MQVNEWKEFVLPVFWPALACDWQGKSGRSCSFMKMKIHVCKQSTLLDENPLNLYYQITICIISYYLKSLQAYVINWQIWDRTGYPDSGGVSVIC